MPYTALGYEITQDYDERTRLFAWRMYFATAAGVTIQWLYKLCLMAGETEVEGVRVVSWVIAAIVLGFGVIPAFAAHEQTVVEDQEKVNVFKSIKSAMRNRPFILLIISYVILVTAVKRALAAIGDNVMNSLFAAAFGLSVFQSDLLI